MEPPELPVIDGNLIWCNYFRKSFGVFLKGFFFLKSNIPQPNSSTSRYLLSRNENKWQQKDLNKSVHRAHSKTRSK